MGTDAGLRFLKEEIVSMLINSSGLGLVQYSNF